MSTPTRTSLSRARAAALQDMANRLRRHALAMTAEAGSGHPTSALSCAEIVSVLFFEHLRFHVGRPHDPANDRFVLSKGHASPILWAAWAEAGAFPLEALAGYRMFDSELEGHPTPRSPWVDVATGSLGQGLSVAVGMALASRLARSSRRVFCLMGDGEIAEGSVWEAAAFAGHEKPGGLVAIVDVNRLGQSGPTMLGHDLDAYARRFEAFGWRTRIVDGHDVPQVSDALGQALEPDPRPAVVLARTLKGKGVSEVEDREGFHGKPITGEALARALAEVGGAELPSIALAVAEPDPGAGGTGPGEPAARPVAPPAARKGDRVATRRAFGEALAKLAAHDPRIVVLDGDVKNSTFTEAFAKAAPDRLVEVYIAEQNMIGIAVGLAASGRVPVAATFAAFLTRAFDQLRMATVSRVHLCVCGSHAGVSIGEDGPSQMGLEDVAMMRTLDGSIVLCASDAVSAERLTALAIDQPGIVYLRTLRPDTPVLYEAGDAFRIGGSRWAAGGPGERVTIVASGITVHEALAARDVLAVDGIGAGVLDTYSLKPLDEETIRAAAARSDAIVTVEDHRPEGGLGEAVAALLAGTPVAFRALAVRGIPRSGTREQLLEAHGISARAIEAAVREAVGHGRETRTERSVR